MASDADALIGSSGHAGSGSGRRASVRSRAGLTLLEMAVAMTILMAGLSAFLKAIVGSMELHRISADMVLAHQALRAELERLEGEDFFQVFALYNDDPDDDPEGVGTAPGRLFQVEGLHPLTTDPDGVVGEVLFPVDPLGPRRCRISRPT